MLFPLDVSTSSLSGLIQYKLCSYWSAMTKISASRFVQISAFLLIDFSILKLSYEFLTLIEKRISLNKEILPLRFSLNFVELKLHCVSAFPFKSVQ